MSTNIASNEELELLERGALATLAKEAKDGDAVAARALLARVDKIRATPGRLQAIDDPEAADKLINAHKPAHGAGSRLIVDVGPAPAMPTADLSPLEHLQYMYRIEQHSLKVAQARQRIKDIPKITRRMGELYEQLAKMRRPSGADSPWQQGTSTEQFKRFAVAMKTAPPELLAAAVAESKRRAKVKR